MAHEYFNPYGNERPHYQLQPPEADGTRRIIGVDGRCIASIQPGGNPLRDEENGRMMAFAGKLHWALGNACAGTKAIAQDISVAITLIAKDPKRAAEVFAKVARDASDLAAREHKAYEGALLIGEKAAQFDADWKQDGIADPAFAAVEQANTAPLPMLRAPDAFSEYQREFNLLAVQRGIPPIIEDFSVPEPLAWLREEFFDTGLHVSEAVEAAVANTTSGAETLAEFCEFHGTTKEQLIAHYSRVGEVRDLPAGHTR